MTTTFEMTPAQLATADRLAAAEDAALVHAQLHERMLTADELAAPFIAGIYRLQSMVEHGEDLMQKSSAPNADVDARARLWLDTMQEATTLVVRAALACTTAHDERRRDLEHHVRAVLHAGRIAEELGWELDSSRITDLAVDAGYVGRMR